MTKILMVCMGNICRSPMAEGIMKKVLEEKNFKATVDSAGTLDYHEGEAPDVRAVKKAKEHGVDISMLRARPFETADFDNFDQIFVMDKHNLSEILKKSRSKEDSSKVIMIMNEVLPGEDIEVPDPYYGGEQGFENVYQMLTQACRSIADKMK